MLNIRQKLTSGYNRLKDTIDRDSGRSGVQFLTPKGREVFNRGANIVNKVSPISNQNYQGSWLQKSIQAHSRGLDAINKSPLSLPSQFTKDYGENLMLKPAMQSAKYYKEGKPLQGTWEAVKTLGAFTPKAIPSMAISGTLGSIQAKSSGQDVKQGFWEGASQGAGIGKFVGATNPVLSKVVGRFAPGAGFVANRVTPAVANIAQGVALDKSSGMPTTIGSVALDAVTGLAGGKGQFDVPVNKKTLGDLLKKGKALGFDGISPRVNKVHPEDLDIMREFADKMLRGKGQKGELGELGVSAQRLAEHYFGGKWATADNKKLAQAFEWAIDLNMHIPRETRGQLPKLGIMDDEMGQSVISTLKPKTKTLQQADELMQKGQQALIENQNRAQWAQESRSMFSDQAIKEINRLKQMARSKAFQQGDIETLRKKDGKFIDKIVETVREAHGDESIPDDQALDIALNLPTKANTRVVRPNEIVQANQLKQKAKQLRDYVFNSETDLPTKEKVLQQNQDLISDSAINDFREWQNVLTKQEGLKTSRGQVTRNIENIGKTIQDQTVPGYVRNIKSDISNLGKGMTDVYRNFDKVFGKDSRAHKEILQPFNRSKGQLVDDLGSWSDSLENNIVKKFNIQKGSKESAAVQLYGEGKIDFGTLKSQFGETRAKEIVEADKWFRSAYDKLLEEVNTVRKQIYPNNPEKIIPRRNDYYRHFVDLSDTFSGLKNLFDNPANISPELAGLSARTLPKSKWLSFAQKRIGNKTTNDAVGGFIEYIKAQSYAKNIDPHIEKFRQLREELVKATNDPKTPEYAKVNNFVEFLDDFANDLAGKTSDYDRGIQKSIGRKSMNVINWINNRTKANLIVGNLSSVVAQFFNIPQGIAEAGVLNTTRGLGRMSRDLIDRSGPINKSIFIKERYSGDIFNRFDKGVLANTKKAAVWITGIGDEIGTKLIWNSVYEKAIQKGIKNPIAYTDDITRKMVAGRGIGEVPLLQKSKTLQLIAPFQLEVANVWHVMREWAGEKAAGKFVTFFVASHIMNRVASNLRGSDVSLDPIQAMKEAYNSYQEEDNKRVGVARAGGRLAGEVFSNLPILGQPIAGGYDEFGGGFLGGALENITGKKITRKELFGEGDPTRFGGGLLAMKGLYDPLFNLVPSYGGKQIQRTLQGIDAFRKGYSESASGRVRFPVERNISNAIKSATFGQYSLPEARQYFDSNTSSLGDKQSEVFKQMPQSEQRAFYDTILKNREKDKLKSSMKSGDGEYTDLDLIEAKRSNNFPLTDNEASIYYKSKLQSFDQNTRYGRELTEKNKWDTINTLSGDDKLSEEQKFKVAQSLGVKPQEYGYYQVAKQESADVRYGYVLDSIENISDRKELLKTLVSFRFKINNKQVLTNPLIEQLYDEGIIGPNERKLLKNYDFDKNTNSVVRSKKSGSGKKLVTNSDILSAFDKLMKSYMKISEPRRTATLGDYLRSRQKQFKIRA